ncbi:MAG: DUF1761 domain-containing protein [Aureispira sp.]|nr:DUF1761 domain-containing protein [Aureispira sp.]
MELKFWIIPIAALIPMIMGFLWYGPIMGKAWMKETGMTEEKAKEGNMAVIFGLSYLLSNFLGFALLSITVHQMGIFSLFAGQEGFGVAGGAAQVQFEAVVAPLKDLHRTFGHGAFHGAIAGVCIAFTILATNAMFEMKSWKYIWINSGYWIITMALMGGVICQFV